jgi:HSP20 family molecular chaperone IbpA
MAIVEKHSDSLQQLEESSDKVLYRVYPDISRRIDHEDRNVGVEISLPGVPKESIGLKALPTWFHLEARRGQMEYNANKSWGFEIIPEKTTAKYENGLLRIHATIRDPLDDAKEVAL